MIKCYHCPLEDVCPVCRVDTGNTSVKLKLNWLPDSCKDECPLYKVVNKGGKRK